MIHDIHCGHMRGRMKGGTLSQWPPCVSCGNRPRLYLKKEPRKRKEKYIKRNEASLLQFVELVSEFSLKKKASCWGK